MATLARSAPLPERSALVEDPRSQEIIQRSRSLIEKILLSIPDAHRSSVHSEVRQADRQTDRERVVWVQIEAWQVFRQSCEAVA